MLLKKEQYYAEEWFVAVRGECFLYRYYINTMYSDTNDTSCFIDYAKNKTYK